MEPGNAGLFWGVVLKPDKRYEQVVEEDFRITKACVDPSTLENGKVTSVILEKDNDEFIICNLTNPTGLDRQMDLAFCEGEKVTFRTEGGATVHLTGHVQPEEPDMEQMGFPGYDEGSEEEEGEEEEEEGSDEEGEEEEEEETPPKLVKKRKAEMVNGANGDAQSAKKQKKEAVKQAEAMKKILSKDKKEEDDDDDSDEYEDMDDDMDQAEGENEEGSDNDDEEESDESPAKAKKEAAKPKESPKAKKDKKAKNGGTAAPEQAPSSPKKESKKAEKVKEEAPKTPKPAAAETEPGKKKKNKNKFKEGAENGQQQQAKTPGKDAKDAKTPAKDGAAKTPAKDGAPKTPAKKTLKGGVVVEDIKVGNGPEAKSGKMVGMYYDGKLTQGGKRFDACKSGKPFKFKLGKGEVIKGWDIGLEGIKVGGKRKLTIPAHMGYGASGAAPEIPPNASLTFEVECKTVN